MITEILLKQLKNGDLVLFHNEGAVPWAIRTFTHSWWNHVGVYKDGFVIEARVLVVKTSIYIYLENPKFDIGIFRVKQSSYASKEEYDKAIITACTRAEGHIGKKYDKRAILWLGIKYLTRGFLGWLLPQQYNPWQNREEFHCSELACDSFYLTSSLKRNIFAGIKYPQAKCGTITPGDIAKRSEFIMGSEKI